MFLFIFESLGTSELVLIGIVALMFLGPRKLPEMARKVGKIMNDFRNTTNEFKETWQKEVNFEEEAKAFSIEELDSPTVPRTTGSTESKQVAESQPIAPEIRSIDPESFKVETPSVYKEEETVVPEYDENDKKNWL